MELEGVGKKLVLFLRQEGCQHAFPLWKVAGSRGKTEDSELIRQWFWAGFPRSLEWREVSLDRAGPDDILLNTGKARNTGVGSTWSVGVVSPSGFQKLWAWGVGALVRGLGKRRGHRLRWASSDTDRGEGESHKMSPRFWKMYMYLLFIMMEERQEGNTGVLM